MKSLPYHIFIDTNVLINDILFRQFNRPNSKPSFLALDYLLRVARRETFVASFSIVQVLSTLEKARISQEIIRQELQLILSKHTIINFSEKDIQAALDGFMDLDIEDTFQFVVSQKMRCQYIITENVKDFRTFQNVRIIRPKEIRRIVF
jgi:predicted nucleic acid-binding protein